MGARSRAVCGIAIACLALACASDETTPAQDTATSSGSGGEPTATGCAPGELELSGACQPAGVPAELCGEGFAPDGAQGCSPLLPPAPCPPGSLAIPGETRCREVASCGTTRWGELVTDATSEHVDADFSGVSDGSPAAPWPTIQEAVDAAEDGAIVAVAAGTYAEDVAIEGKAVRLRGRCPGLVEIAGVQRSVLVALGADGSEISGVAVSSADQGISVSGAEDVLLERVRVYDTRLRGINVLDVLGPTSATVRDVLVEDNFGIAVFIGGAEVTLERSVIRNTDVGANGSGRGVAVQLDPDTGAAATATIRRCVVENNRDMGIAVFGGTATVESTLVRGTEAAVDLSNGFGLVLTVQDETLAPSLGDVRASVFESNRAAGILVAASRATVSGVVVRDTQPEALDEQRGNGILVQDLPRVRAAAELTVSSSLLAGNHEVGLAVLGGELTADGVAVRDTAPRPSGLFGRGVQVQDSNATGRASSALLRSCAIDRGYEVGVFVVSSAATLEHSRISDIAPNPSQLFGDGVAVFAYGAPASATLADLRIERSARAGISSFGAVVSLQQVTQDCNAIPLNGEIYDGAAFAFDDQGGNVCSCNGAVQTCAVASSNLLPPDLGER